MVIKSTNKNSKKQLEIDNIDFIFTQSQQQIILSTNAKLIRMNSSYKKR